MGYQPANEPDIAALSSELHTIQSAYSAAVQKAAELAAEIQEYEARRQYIAASMEEGQRLASFALRSAELRVDNINSGRDRLIMPQRQLIARIEEEIDELNDILLSLTGDTEGIEADGSHISADNIEFLASLTYKKVHREKSDYQVDREITADGDDIDITVPAVELSAGLEGDQTVPAGTEDLGSQPDAGMETIMEEAAVLSDSAETGSADLREETETPALEVQVPETDISEETTVNIAADMPIGPVEMAEPETGPSEDVMPAAEETGPVEIEIPAAEMEAAEQQEADQIVSDDGPLQKYDTPVFGAASADKAALPFKLSVKKTDADDQKDEPEAKTIQLRRNRKTVLDQEPVSDQENIEIQESAPLADVPPLKETAAMVENAPVVEGPAATAEPAAAPGENSPDLHLSPVEGNDPSLLSLDIPLRFSFYAGEDRQPESLRNHQWTIQMVIKIPEDNFQFVPDGDGARDIHSILRQYDRAILNDLHPFDIVTPSRPNIGMYFYNCLEDNLASMNLLLREISIWEDQSMLVRVNYRNKVLDELLQNTHK